MENNDYKEKYESLIDAIKVLRDTNPSDEGIQNWIKDFVPELAESEDERIRKEFITHCRNTRCVTEEGAERIAKWIDWLEKQGEQKPQRMISAEAKEAMYDKPDWSEEDKRILDALITSLINARFAGRLKFLKGIKVSLVIDWLKSLKEKRQ